jgi:hypothetical protein
LSINYETEKYIQRAAEKPAIKRVAINLVVTAIGQNAKENTKPSITQTPSRRDNCSELSTLTHFSGTVATVVKVDEPVWFSVQIIFVVP